MDRNSVWEGLQSLVGQRGLRRRRNLPRSNNDRQGDTTIQQTSNAANDTVMQTEADTINPAIWFSQRSYAGPSSPAPVAPDVETLQQLEHDAAVARIFADRLAPDSSWSRTPSTPPLVSCVEALQQLEDDAAIARMIEEGWEEEEEEEEEQASELQEQKEEILALTTSTTNDSIHSLTESELCVFLQTAG